MFQGSIPALITPFKNGNIDYESFYKIIEWSLSEGSHGFVPCGTTGESPTLSHQEHIKVVDECVRIVDKRVPVIAGTGSNNTIEAIEFTNHAEKSGADAALVVTPYYNKPTQEGLYLHYKLIAEKVPLPQILYNVPGRTACDLLPETVERLADFSNIVAIKEATGDLQRAKDIMQRCGDRLDVISGDDATAMELILNGAKGDISVTANVAPQAMHDMCAAALAGDRDLAMKINEPLQALHNDLFVEASPIPIKFAVHKMGYGSNTLRLPMTALSQENEAVVIAAMKKANVL